MWSSGDPVLWRAVSFGHVRLAFAHRFVADREDVVALWLAAGTPGMRFTGASIKDVLDLDSNDWSLGEVTWMPPSVLKLWRPGRAHSVWLFLDGEELLYWYVNLEEPWRRTALGFDTRDHALDIVVDPDGAWRWKDEDHLEQATANGRFTREQALAIRAEGERVIIERPWPTGWEDWVAPADWQPPALPEGWDGV
jgi:hypothetical protein